MRWWWIKAPTRWEVMWLRIGKRKTGVAVQLGHPRVTFVWCRR